MLSRTLFGALGMLALVGTSISGYAYATSCGSGATEVYEMALISVTYDGTPQVNSPDYTQVSGELRVYPSTNGWFVIVIERQDTTPPTVLEAENYYAH